MLQIANSKQTFFSRVCLFAATFFSGASRPFSLVQADLFLLCKQTFFSCVCLFAATFFSCASRPFSLVQADLFLLCKQTVFSCASKPFSLVQADPFLLCKQTFFSRACFSLACIFKYISIIKANIITADNSVQLIQTNAFNSNAFNPIHNFIRVENKLFTS